MEGVPGPDAEYIFQIMDRSANACALALWGVLLALGGAPAAANVFAIAATGSGSIETQDSTAAVPDDATLEASGAVIGEVIVHSGDIFDPEQPGESNVVFRAANKLHINTRDRTIRQLVLFHDGDPYSRRILDESERLLRSTGYLYDAKIRPLRYDGERVTVLVETRDVWTLGVGAGLGRSGGSNTAHFGLEDRNFLGTGKDIAVQQRRDVDRTETMYRYSDPNLFGSRTRLQLRYANLSDGKSTLVSAGRPFYSLSSRWAVGAAGSTDDRIDSLYTAGVITSQFRHQTVAGEAYGGISRGLVNGRARRFLYGFAYSKEEFGAPTDPASVPPATMPSDRTLSYPWVGYEEIQDGYFTAHDMDQIQRTEDHNLGREIHARIGYSAPAFGGDRNRAVYEARIAQGLNPGNGQTLFLSSGLSGRYGGEGAENLLLSGSARYLARDMGENLFYAFLGGDVAQNLDSENQLLIGGDNGVRGYPLRYQEGDRRVRLSIEQRFYMPWHLLKLVHVGAAVFYDAGAAWWSGDASATSSPLLQDVGFGLRLSSSRSARGGMVHVDLAFPLNPPDGVPHYQLSVQAGETF